MRILPLLAVTACTSEPQNVEIYDYTLKLVPMTPLNQSPFDGLARLDLVAEPAVGDPQTWTLSTSESGASPTVTGLGPLEDVTLALEGYSAAGMVSFGRSDPITISEGQNEVNILVSELDRFAWFNSLTVANYAGAMASDGEGRFLLFGGNTGGTAVADELEVSDAIWALDVAPPDGAFTFTELGAMPARADDGEAQRMGHTATLLDQGGAAGLIFVAAGATGHFQAQTALGDAFLWDPATGETVSQMDLIKARHFHQAVQNQAGQVLLIGGMSLGSEGSIGLQMSVEIVDPETGTSELAVGSQKSGYLWTSATDIGADGVLTCGGVAPIRDAWLGAEGCDLVSNSGTIQGGIVTLEEPLIMASLARLGEGRALLTGGLVTTDVEELNDGSAEVPATDRAWIYEDGTLREVESMHIARGAHGSAPLPDGRVLVFGGITGTSSGLYPEAFEAVACAEIFDPETEKFYEVESCDAESTSSPLPGQTAFPVFAADPLYGLMTAGGLDPNQSGRSGNDASTGVAWFVSCPDPDKC